MRTNTQTMPTIMVINDLIPALEHSAESLIHWDFSDEEDETCGKISFSCGEWSDSSDEQEWNNDYINSIRL